MSDSRQKWEQADEHKRTKRDVAALHSRCPHGSKLVEGNEIRCAQCKKLVGFVRAPK